MALPLSLRLIRMYGLYMPIARGKGRVAKWAYRKVPIPKKPILATITKGVKTTLHPWLWADFCTYLIGSPEPYTLAYFRSLLRPDSIVFDIGAYIGVYSFTTNQIITTGQVHAFEPHPQSAERIAKTIERNNLANIHLNNCAIGDHSDVVPFILHQTPVQSGIKSRAANGTEQIKIKMDTIDSYCQHQNIEHIDVMKVDVEGAELSVFCGAEQIIGKSRPILIVELHKPESRLFGYSTSDTINWLRDQQYELFCLAHGVTTTPKLRPFAGMEQNRQIIIAKPTRL